MTDLLPIIDIAPSRLFEIAVTAVVGFNCGCISYIVIIEAPGRATLSASNQVKQWRSTFTRASNFFKPLGLMLVPALLSCAYVTGKPLYYLAALPHGLLAPFTAVKIAPTNTRLLEMSLPEDGSDEAGEAEQLISTWAKLHKVRVAMCFAGYAAAFWACTVIKSK